MTRSSFVGFAANINLVARVLSFLVVAFWNSASAAESNPIGKPNGASGAGGKKEGSLSLYMYQGGGAGTMAQLFQNIRDQRGGDPGRGNTFAPKIMAEQRAGKYLVDAYIAGATTAFEFIAGRF
jgi:hypothetical protein